MFAYENSPRHLHTETKYEGTVIPIEGCQNQSVSLVITICNHIQIKGC